MGVIYAITADGEEYRYVGLTTAPLKRREYEHRLHARIYQRTPIHHWLNKHPEAVFVVLEDGLEDTALDSAEVHWIAKLKTEGHSLLNLTGGGRNAYTLDEDVKKRMSETTSRTQKLSADRAKALYAGRDKWLAENKALLSERISGHRNPNYGKPWSEERREKTQRSRLKAAGWTEDDIRSIRNRAAEGETQTKIAAEYSVLPSTISKIVARKKWAWIE